MFHNRIDIRLQLILNKGMGVYSAKKYDEVHVSYFFSVCIGC